MHPARNGYLWLLERRADAIAFVDAKPYVKQTAFKSIDPRPGARRTTRRKKPVTGKKVAFCPSLWGGKDWVPAAYSPKTGYLYIPANENLCGSLLGSSRSTSPASSGSAPRSRTSAWTSRPARTTSARSRRGT